MTLLVPLSPISNQAAITQLNGQNVQLNVRQTLYGLFMDVLVNNGVIISSVLCLDRNLIVRNLYFQFQGDFAWFDTQGTNDPDFTGIGTRYFLAYFSPDELLTT